MDLTLARCKRFWHCLRSFVAHFVRSWTCWTAVSLSNYATLLHCWLFVTVSATLSVAVALTCVLSFEPALNTVAVE